MPYLSGDREHILKNPFHIYQVPHPPYFLYTKISSISMCISMSVMYVYVYVII